MAQATGQQGRQEGLKEEAVAKVQDAASVAQDKASELREQGSARLRDQFDQRSSEAGTQVRSVAEALRRSGNELRNAGKGNAAELTGRAADRIEWVGGYLERKSGEELMRDIESFARRRPWMLTGIGMLAGVAAARFMGASSGQRYDSYRQASRQSSNRPGQGDRPQLPTSSGGSAGRTGAGGSKLEASLSEDTLAREPYAGRR